MMPLKTGLVMLAARPVVVPKFPRVRVASAAPLLVITPVVAVPWMRVVAALLPLRSTSPERSLIPVLEWNEVVPVRRLALEESNRSVPAAATDHRPIKRAFEPVPWSTRVPALREHCMKVVV